VSHVWGWGWGWGCGGGQPCVNADRRDTSASSNVIWGGGEARVRMGGGGQWFCEGVAVMTAIQGQ
jgi:hypothetical protein